MISTRQSIIKKLVCILLAVCMVIGLMPVMSLPARADDSPNTIGTLEDGTPRYGNGWMWDGNPSKTRGTLTLFGANINAGSDDFRSAFTYDGDISIELVGYNKVSSAASNAVFAGINGNCAYISGSGVLEIDCPFGSNVEISSGYIKSSAAELLGNYLLTMNGGCIIAPYATSYNVKINKGYLDVKAISQKTDVYGGYLKAKEALNSSYLRIQNSVVEITGQMAGFVDFLKENSVFIYNDTMWSGRFNESGNDYKNNIYRHLVDSTTVVLCQEYIDVADTVINKQKRGVYSEKPVKIEEGGYFLGGNYFKISDDDYAIYASGTGDTQITYDAAIVTNGGKGIYLDNAKLGDGTTAVNVNGGDNGTGITLENSSTGNGSTLVAANSSVYLSDGSTVGEGSDVISNCSAQADFGDFTLSENSCMTICSSSKDTFNIDKGKINGSLTYASENGGININISDDNSTGTTIGLYSMIAAYVSDGKILKNEWYVPTHTFYYADDIGTEFRTTTDTAFKQHTAKAVYYGRELQPRLDADVYEDDNGEPVESTASMSAGGNDTAQFVISSSCKITSPNTDVTASLITPYGQTSQNAGFTMNIVGGNDKRIMVEMKLNGAVVPGKYKVCVNYSDRSCEFPIELTNSGLDTPQMDFTAGSGAWDYYNINQESKSFTGTDSNVTDGKGWAWYGAPAESDGYDKYTLVLNNFNGMGDHPIKLPAGSTIILKGINTIATLGSGIVCSGSLTITRDDLETGYLICRAGENGEDTAAIYVTNGNLTIKGVTVDLSVETSDSDSSAVHAGFSFIINDAIVTLSVSHIANSTFCDAVSSDEMYLGGTSTLTAQAPGNIFGGFSFVSALAESIENVSGLTLDQYNDSCKNNDGIIITGNYLTCDNKTMPLVIKTKGVTVDKNKVNLPAFTGANTWNVLTGYLNVSNGSGNYTLIDKDNALAELSGKNGISSISLSGGNLNATFDETFEGCSFTFYVDELWPELRGDGEPIRVTIDRYYTITATNSTGIGSVVLAENNSDNVIRGGSTAYEIIPAMGYKISSIVYNGEDITDQVDKYSGGTLTLENIVSDGTLDVEFAMLGTFSLDVNSDDIDHLSYNIEPDASGSYQENTQVTVTLTPDADWAITAVRLNGTELALTADGKYTFAVTEATALDVEMEYLIKSVTVNKTGEGTAESSAQTVTKGGGVEFTIIPADGWRLKSAELDGADVMPQIGADGKLAVDNVTADITLDVVFEEIPVYALDVTIPHGSYTVDPAGLSYREGTQVTVTLTPEADWAITAVRLNGTELALTADGKYTFAVTEATTLDVEMEYLIKSVTVNKTGEGTAESSAQTVNKGNGVEFTVIPADGWRLKSAELDGADVMPQIGADGKLTVDNVTADITITVEFEKIPEYTLTIPEIFHGSYTVEPAGDSFIENTEVTVTVTTEENWVVSSVKLNGRELALTADNKYTFSMTENMTFAAETEYLLGTVTIRCGAGGKVSPESTEILKGTQATFTITPDSGYRIGSVKLNGEALTVTDGAVTFTVTEDCTLSVEFEKIPEYTLTIPEIFHGSYTVEPAGASFIENTEVTVTVTTDENWVVSSVKLNGRELALTADNKYTFSMTENMTFAAETEYLLGTVTIRCGAGGKVSPESTEILKGTQATFTITPDSGYRIGSVKLNGEALTVTDGAVTFTVTDDCTLAVEFEKIPEYTLTIPEISHGSYIVEPAGASFIENTEVTVTVTTEENWVVSSIKLNGRELALTADNKYTFSMTENVTFEVSTECLLRTVTVVCGTGGKVSPENAEILKGTQATFTITPDSGYRIGSVKLNGVVQKVSNGTVTFTVTEDCTLTIEFTRNGGSSGGGSGSARPSRPAAPSQNSPSLNGSEKSWEDIVNDLNKTPGGSVVISLNGNTTVPADIIGAIRDSKVKAEFVFDSAKSWIVDGSKLPAAVSADLSLLYGTADKSALRGVNGADLTVNGTGVPADLKLSFRKEFAGQFANVYRLVDNKLVFQGCFRVGEDGSAVISGADTAGEYVVMVCRYSDLPGDVNNDGVLNALDAAAILKDIVELGKCENAQVGDLNGDSVMNAMDASAILKYVVM